MAGCVYAMVIPQWRRIRRIGQSKVTNGLIKIGHVISPENLKPRRANLSSQYDVEFVGLHSVETPNYLEEERSLHEKFASRQVPVDNQLGGEGKEIFDLRPEEAISALKQIRNGRVVKPAVSWSVSGKTGQRFHPEEWRFLEEQEGIEEWEDSIVIYVCDGYTQRDVDRGVDIEEDSVWFGQDVPYLLAQQPKYDFQFEAVAKVNLSTDWKFEPDDPRSDFPFWGIISPDGELWPASHILNERPEGVKVVRIGGSTK